MKLTQPLSSPESGPEADPSDSAEMSLPQAVLLPKFSYTSLQSLISRHILLTNLEKWWRSYFFFFLLLSNFWVGAKAKQENNTNRAFPKKHLLEEIKESHTWSRKIRKSTEHLINPNNTNRLHTIFKYTFLNSTVYQTQRKISKFCLRW